MHNPVQCSYYITYLIYLINPLYYPIVSVVSRWILLCSLLQVSVFFSVAVSLGCWGNNWSCIFAKKQIYLAPIIVWVSTTHFGNWKWSTNLSRLANYMDSYLASDVSGVCQHVWIYVCQQSLALSLATYCLASCLWPLAASRAVSGSVSSHLWPR